VKQYNGAEIDELILKELNEHLKALITLCIENKRDLDYVKYNLDYIKFKLDDLENKPEAPKNLINKKNWNWVINPSFDALSDRDK